MFHTRAIILSTRPYREHDELISLFSERFGKRTILARGTRKSTSKLAASLHTPKMLMCSFVDGRGYPILTSLDHIENGGQRSDFYGSYFLYAFLALCDDILYEGDADEKLWNLMAGVVQAASQTQGKEKKEWICIYDEWLRGLLGALGIEEKGRSKTEERPLLRKAFADVYYRNPYPLEPFILSS